MSASEDSHYVNVRNARMHYISQGEGSPIVFVHGMPTSSYVWRHILPKVAQYGRCIALDLIGMGKSDKPEIHYTIQNHIDYFTGFIEALDLKKITLVMHGWGSVIGFSYARQHPENIEKLAFLESYLRLPDSVEDLPPLYPELFQGTRDIEQLKQLVIEENYFIEKLLPAITLKKLTADELKHYGEPFTEKKHRQVLWQFMLDQHYLNQKSVVPGLIQNYSDWLQKTDIPKLMMYAIPGMLTPISTVTWAMAHLPNLTVVEVGEGLHYLPETLPDEIAQALADWL